MNNFTPAEKNIANEIEILKKSITEKEADIIKLNNMIKKLQSFCEHKHYTLHPRQEGYSSYKECEICGEKF